MAFFNKWFSKDTSRARNLAKHVDEHKSLKSRKRYSWLGLGTSIMMLPTLFISFGPILGTTMSIAGCLGACASLSIYDVLLTQFKKQHDLPVSRTSEFIFTQVHKVAFVRELLACKNEADLRTKYLRTHFNRLADRHEKIIEESKQSKEKKSALENECKLADNDISYYQRALRILSPSSNLVKAGTFALVVFAFAKRAMLDIALSDKPKKQSPSHASDIMPNIYLLRIMSLASVVVVTALQSKIAVTKALINNQKLVPRIIKDIADYSTFIPGLTAIQNFLIRRELKGLDGKKEITDMLIEEISDLGVSCGLKQLADLSRFVPKGLLKEVFEKLDEKESTIRNLKTINHQALDLNL